MTQTVNVFAEYAQYMAVLLDGFIIVLLLVALHRMKQIVKAVQAILIEEKEGQADEKKAVWRSENLTEDELGALLENETRFDGQSEVPSVCPEVLLTEVLEEVFP